MLKITKTAKQLACRSLVWLAAIAVCANPLLASGSQCGCGHEAKPVVSAPAAHSCCSKKTESSNESKSCCLSKKTETIAAKSATCKCGDKCQCKVDRPKQPIPVVPANSTSQNDQLSVALPAESAFAEHLVRTSNSVRYGRWLVHPPEHTALETCALLSRFIC